MEPALRGSLFNLIVGRLSAPNSEQDTPIRGYVQILDLPTNLLRLDWNKVNGLQVPVYDGKYFAHAIFRGDAKDALKAYVEKFSDLPPSQSRERRDKCFSDLDEFSTACSDDMEEDYLLFARVMKSRLLTRFDSLESYSVEFIFVFTEIAMLNTMSLELVRRRLPNRLFPMFRRRMQDFYDSTQFLVNYLEHRCLLNGDRNFHADPGTRSLTFKLLNTWKKTGVAIQLLAMDTTGTKRQEPFLWCPRSYVELTPYGTERDLATQLGNHILSKADRVRAAKLGKTPPVPSSEVSMSKTTDEIPPSKKAFIPAVTTVVSSDASIPLTPSSSKLGSATSAPPKAARHNSAVTTAVSKSVSSPPITRSFTGTSRLEPTVNDTNPKTPPSVLGATNLEEMAMDMTECDVDECVQSPDISLDLSHHLPVSQPGVFSCPGKSTPVSSNDTFLTADSPASSSLMTEDEESSPGKTLRRLFSRTRLGSNESPPASTLSFDAASTSLKDKGPTFGEGVADVASTSSPSSPNQRQAVHSISIEMSRLASLTKPTFCLSQETSSSAEDRRLESLTVASTPAETCEQRRLELLSFLGETFEDSTDHEDPNDDSFETVSQMDLAGVSSFYAIKTKGSPKRSPRGSPRRVPTKRTSTPLDFRDHDDDTENKRSRSEEGRILANITPRRPIRNPLERSLNDESLVTKTAESSPHHEEDSSASMASFKTALTDSQPASSLPSNLPSNLPSQLDIDAALLLIPQATQQRRLSSPRLVSSDILQDRESLSDSDFSPSQED